MPVSAGIRVDGGRHLRRALKNAPDRLEDLKKAHAEAAGIVAAAGKPAAPRGETGRLAGSVRPGATKTTAVVRAGRASVPYANPIHWGWRKRHIKAQPWLSNTAQATEPAWTQIYENAVARVLDTIKGINE